MSNQSIECIYFELMSTEIIMRQLRVVAAPLGVLVVHVYFIEMPPGCQNRLST